MSNLLAHSNVLIYGRVLAGLTIDASVIGTNGLGGNNFLREQLTAKDASGNYNQKFAMIYGFEFEGHYYDLYVPAILLVHGDGTTPKAAGAVVASEPDLADDVKVWAYDKADFSIRLDIDSGPLESILLEETLDDEGLFASSGKKISGKQISGKKVSGKKLRGD